MKRASERESDRFVRPSGGAPSQSHTNKSAAGRKDGRQERPLKEPKERRTGQARGHIRRREAEERGYLSKISQRLTASSVLSLAAISGGSNRSSSKIGSGIGFKDSFAYFGWGEEKNWEFFDFLPFWRGRRKVAAAASAA